MRSCKEMVCKKQLLSSRELRKEYLLWTEFQAIYKFSFISFRLLEDKKPSDSGTHYYY